MENLFALYAPRPHRGATAVLHPAPTYRAAAAGDALALARLTADREGVSISAQLMRFEHELALPNERLLLVAERDGALVGYGRAIHFGRNGEMPRNVCPEGWYLGGVMVRPDARREGIGRALTVRRLAWLKERTDCAYFVVNALNRPSIDLHIALGFVEVTRDFEFPGVTFTGGEGILFCKDWTSQA